MVALPSHCLPNKTYIDGDKKAETSVFPANRQGGIKYAKNERV